MPGSRVAVAFHCAFQADQVAKLPLTSTERVSMALANPESATVLMVARGYPPCTVSPWLIVRPRGICARTPVLRLAEKVFMLAMTPALTQLPRCWSSAAPSGPGAKAVARRFVSVR